MLEYVKRLVPKPVKRVLRRPFDYLAKGMQQRIGQLEQRIEELQALVFELTPDVVQPSADILPEVTDLLAQNGLSSAQVNLRISKHDPMYQVMVRPSTGKDWAYLHYLRGGLSMVRILEPILRARYDEMGKIGSVLDFASGYGRMTRFLATKLDPGRIWVSDIKARAVEFQRRQFGVNGFVSTAEPEDLKSDERFDVIFVASLFSHLPESTFCPLAAQTERTVSARRSAHLFRSRSQSARPSATAAGKGDRLCCCQRGDRIARRGQSAGHEPVRADVCQRKVCSQCH